ncbi:hypothetical protein ACE6H2_003011 [Prunus campanulata]
METFCIGELDTTSSAIAELEITSKNQAVDYPQKIKDLTKQYWTVPVAVIGISVRDIERKGGFVGGGEGLPPVGWDD